MKDTPQPFAVGDKVTSAWDPVHADLVRTVIDVRENTNFASGWAISSDDGNEPETRNILLIDSSWFLPAHLCAKLP